MQQSGHRGHNADIGKVWDRKRTHRGGRERDEDVCTMDEADRGREQPMPLVRGKVTQKVSHIHRKIRFPFREMATVIDMSRLGESTRGHAATPNDN